MYIWKFGPLYEGVLFRPYMLTIAVLSQKGGVGKTTLAVNLAAAAHLAGKRTLVLDLDKQGSALDWAAARTEGSKLSGLAVAKYDKALAVGRFRELSTGYDVVILDGAPRLGDVTRSAAVAADMVLVPITPGPFDLWATAETVALLDAADEIRAELGRAPVVRRFVLNRGSRTGLARQVIDAVREGGGELADVAIGQRVAFGTAAASGESVLTFEPKGQAAYEMSRLYREVAQ